MRLLPLLLTLSACGMENSPWTNDAPATDLTVKHVQRLQDPGDTLTVAIVGDSQAVYGDFARSMERVNARTDVDLTLLVGDITDRGLQKEFEFAVKVIEKAVKPVLTVVGNHDGLSHGKEIYARTFGDLNYTFDYGGHRFVAWNNNGYEWDVDVGWLERQVSSHPRVIVFSHQPPNHASVSSDVAHGWAQIRKSPNLVASVHGHTHVHSFYKEGDLPVYTVQRVIGGAYGIMEIKDDVKFFDCQSTCKESSK